MLSRFAAALLALAFAAVPASAEDWRPLGSTDTSAWAVDRDSLSVSAGIAKFRVEEKFFKPRLGGTVRAVTRMWLDCAKRTYGPFGGEEYGADGRLVTAWSPPRSVPTPVEPDTPGAAFADFACTPPASTR